MTHAAAPGPTAPHPRVPASALRIRAATPQDVPAILAFIRELAEYEHAAHEVLADEAALHRTLFAPQPRVFGLICEAPAQDAATPGPQIQPVAMQAVGFAVYFFNYSTWQGRHGLYLEDLYVRPDQRGQGAGRALPQHLAAIAVAHDCGRFEWSVLDWNAPAIAFYKSLGAQPQSEWVRYRASGAALLALAAQCRTMAPAPTAHAPAAAPSPDALAPDTLAPGPAQCGAQTRAQ